MWCCIQGVFGHSMAWQKPNADISARSQVEQTHRQTDKQKYRQQTDTDRQADRKASRQMKGSTDRHAQTDMQHKQAAQIDSKQHTDNGDMQLHLSPISVWSPAGKSWRSGISAQAFSTCSYLSESMGNPMRMLSCRLQFWIQGSWAV